MPRVNKYQKNVKPHLNKIKEWASSGATVKEIATALGIAESTLHKYKNDYKELSDAFACGREVVICDIKAALLKKALGFTYEETRQSLKQDESGKEVVYTETHKKYCVPSETAAAMLLRNYDDDWKDMDNISVKFKRQEAELKRKIAQANNFIDLEGE